jgi:uncharacterized protein
MRFEWEEDKRQATLARRGIDFIGMAALFDGRPVITYPSPRLGEERWVTIGLVDGKAFAVVWMVRGGKRRERQDYFGTKGKRWRGKGIP